MDSEEVYDALLELTVGDSVMVKIDDFENTNFPKENNPREITGKVERIKKEVRNSAGEIERSVVIGNPRGGGCVIDCGDTGKNKMVTSPVSRKYNKAWRPRTRNKDRLLLGRVVDISVQKNEGG